MNNSKKDGKMTKDFWSPIIDASIISDDGIPRFICSINGTYGRKQVVVYLDEKSTRKSAFRRFKDGLSSDYNNEIDTIVERIIDDLFDRFGASGVLEYNQEEAEKCNLDWIIRMLRKDLKRLGIPETLSRDQVECVLNELYVIDPILNE